jgi:predicted nucleic acid-binding protein
LDTSVLVDFLRVFPPARDWLHLKTDLGVSPIVWMELIEGEENKKGQVRAVKLLHLFKRVDVLPVDFDWAIQQSLRFRLSHNIDMMDCLIASTAYRLNIPIFTTNLKHFQPLLGDLAQKPY